VRRLLKASVELRPNMEDGMDEGDRPATDSSEMTEGVGGTPDIDEDERATVGDVDGDNIQDGEEIRPVQP
jgi:hypothetical protein